MDAGTVIRNWCAYQERSQHETRQKLRSMGVPPDMAEEHIAALISENFLNEERFARAFAGGRFRIKQWGRIKIMQSLRQHRLSERVIESAMKGIDSEDYSGAVRILARRKIATFQLTDRKRKYHGTLRYLVGKGFEAELVRDVLNQILGETDDYEFRT